MTTEMFIRAHIIGKIEPKLKQFVFLTSLSSVISKIWNTNYQNSPTYQNRLNLPYRPIFFVTKWGEMVDIQTF